MLDSKVIVLCPEEHVAMDAVPRQVLEVDAASAETMLWAEDAVEDVIVTLSAIEASWCAGETTRLLRMTDILAELARELALPTVEHVARDAIELLAGQDRVAQAAVIARLLRVGEASLATILDSGYKTI